MKVRLKVILFLVIASSLISCDQIIKGLAKEHLMYKEPVSYFHDVFRLEYAENTGAALSLGDALPQPYSFWLLSVIPLIFMIGMLAYIFIKIKQISTGQLLWFALIFAGGIGNIIDRVFRDRHVTDFMNMGIYQFRTGIFNVADVCITAGVIGLFLSYQVIQNRQKGSGPGNLVANA